MTTNAILNWTKLTEMASSPELRWWHAVEARYAGYDGMFVFAFSSTGIYCRPSCPARRPRRQNVTFYGKPEEAEKAGYRACLRCRPRAIAGSPQMEMVKAVCRYVEQHLDEPITLARLGTAFRQSPFHLQRTFKGVLGITPRAYADSCRLNQLKSNLRAGSDAQHRSEEHTSELQSRQYLVCRLLLEKKKNNKAPHTYRLLACTLL